MPWTPLKLEPVSFPERKDRSRYIAETYGDVLNGGVLDVGCWEAHLRTFLNGANYTGVDVGGRPDIQLNLENPDGLPFGDNSFDCVVCTDVLEHLDNLHAMFAELVRVTRRSIIISLPNNWANARQPIERGRGSFSKYGLPLDPPEDRHKWFFSMSEARAFIEGQAERHNLTITRMHVTEKPRSAAASLLLHILYPQQERYMNRYSNTLWTLLEKQAP